MHGGKEQYFLQRVLSNLFWQDFFNSFKWYYERECNNDINLVEINF